MGCNDQCLGFFDMQVPELNDNVAQYDAMNQIEDAKAIKGRDKAIKGVKLTDQVRSRMLKRINGSVQ